MNNNKIVIEWFEIGQRDIEEAEFLFENDRSLEDVAFFIQQSAEKYLKGYLISQGWKLEKIHDLTKLVKHATRIDKSFSRFIAPLRKITRFYFESRYPLGYESGYTKEEIKKSLDKVKSLIKLIKR